MANKHRIVACHNRPPVAVDNFPVAQKNLFTDGSADPLTKVGYGAYLITESPLSPRDQLAGRVVSQRFTHTSSTRLELQTLLWAIAEVIRTGQLQPQHDHLTIYTDCQTIINLPSRRLRLEQNNYCSKKNISLKNGDLYRQLIRQLDSVSHKLIKVQGHQSAKTQHHIDQIFTLVDRYARQALRDNSTSE